MKSESISMKGLPFPPLDPSWLVESAAFQSDNPKLVRAPLLLLFHAWGAQPAGSIPSEMRRIGAICGMSDVEVGQHYDELTEGWELRGGRLHHIALSALCERLAERFGDAIGHLADQAAAVIQAPEEFELVAPELETSRTKGRRLIPANFGMTAEREAWLMGQGFRTPEDRAFILEKFVLHVQKKNEKFNNWDAAFKSFALREDMRNIPSARNTVVPLVPGGSSRAARFGGHGARGDTSVDHNLNRMAAARGEVAGT